MSFNVESQRASVGVRFYVVLHGTPYVFLDSATPIGPDGATWSTPASKGQNYVIIEDSLDLKSGIKHNSGQIRRRDGKSSPGAMSLVIRENESGQCLPIFAPEKSTGNVATLNENLAYDTDGTGSVVNCDSISGWPGSGLAFLGLECLYYASTGAGTLGTPGDKATRDLFSVGHCDSTHEENKSHAGSLPRVIADYVKCWYNRQISVFAYCVGADGYAYDGAFSLPGSVATYSKEIYRGILTTNPQPTNDYLSWSLRSRSIDALIHTEIGQDPVKGTLIKDQLMHKESGTSSGANVLIYLTDSQHNVSLHVKKWASLASKENGSAGTLDKQFNLTIVNSSNVFTVQSLTTVFNSGMLSHVTGFDDGGSNPLENLTVELYRQEDTSPGADWRIRVQSADSAAYEVTFQFSNKDSIGLPLGFDAGDHSCVVSGANDVYLLHADRRGYAAFIPEDATEIPFFYESKEGINTLTPVSPGHVKIGTEIVYYNAISDTSSVVDGLYRLTGCKRGRMNTEPAEHSISPGQDVESMKLVFGVGFENVDTGKGLSLFDAWRQALISTGSGHHGAYDVLGRIGPAVSGFHFDNVSIDQIKNSIPGHMQNIRLFVSKPTDLMKLAKGWFAALGLYATARPNASGNFLITLDQVIPALESESVTHIGTADLSVSDPAKHLNATSKPVTSIKVQHRWNNASEKLDDDWVTVNNPNAVSEYQTKSTINIPLAGFRLDGGTAYAFALWIASRVWDRYASVYEVVSLKVVSRKGWSIKAGDCILVTCPGVPTSAGVRGYVSRPMVCVEASYGYWARNGELVTTLKCVNEVHVRRSTYCPAASVSSNSSGVLTLDNDAYSDDDASHFDVGDKVTLFERGDFSGTKSDGTISAVSSGTITVTGSASSYVPTVNTRLVAQSYSDCVDSQKEHVFISSASTPSVLTVSDVSAFKYV